MARARFEGRAPRSGPSVAVPRQGSPNQEKRAATPAASAPDESAIRDNPALCPLKMNRPLPSTSRPILFPFWPVPSPPLHSTVARNGTATALARGPPWMLGGLPPFPAREKYNQLYSHSCPFP